VGNVVDLAKSLHLGSNLGSIRRDRRVARRFGEAIAAIMENRERKIKDIPRR